MFRFVPSRFVGASVAVLTLVALLVPGGAAEAAPLPPVRLPAAIEPLATYVGQVSCDPHVRPGTYRLATLLESTYRTGSWASAYACGTDGGQSEHYDGRAIDWMVDIHNAVQYAAARAVLAWMLGTDAAGNRFAVARRLGVMYVIYDNRMWGAWDGQWHPYNNCQNLRSSAYDNSCHRTHMHISLGWNGAMGRTSFWTGHVYATDYGPCRMPDLNWGPRYVAPNYRPCASYPAVHAAAGASAVKQALVKYSGAPIGYGWRGPAVTAVQQALHVPASGYYSMATVYAVRALQRKHGLRQYGSMGIATWRFLLASVR